MGVSSQDNLCKYLLDTRLGVPKYPETKKYKSVSNYISIVQFKERAHSWPVDSYRVMSVEVVIERENHQMIGKMTCDSQLWIDANFPPLKKSKGRDEK